MTDAYSNIESLINGTRIYLEKEYSGQNKNTFFTLFNRGAREILKFSIKGGFLEYNNDTKEQILNYITEENLPYNKFSSIKTALNKIDEFFSYGTVYIRNNSQKNDLSPYFNDIIDKYTNYRLLQGLSELRIKCIKLYLRKFITFILTKNIIEFEFLTQSLVNDFILDFKGYRASSLKEVCTIVKKFLYFLYENKYLKTDLSTVIPSISVYSDDALPTFYTKDEVDSVINIIDRANPRGKRDYAIVLLAARLGLRASEICNLEFNNINWDENIIEFCQVKTKKLVTLPLLNEIGSSIIDYLKVRPHTDVKNIFLSISCPYRKMNHYSIYDLVAKYFYLTGIKVHNRKKHGPHSLRFSLATEMLDKSIPIPVIKSILNHESTTTTKRYLKIDFNNLKLCALDVDI